MGRFVWSTFTSHNFPWEVLPALSEIRPYTRLCLARHDVELGDAARAAGYSNDALHGGDIGFKKSITGLWLCQKVVDEFSSPGEQVRHDVLAEEIHASQSFAAFVDPGAAQFFGSGGMRSRIRDYCLATGQTPPETRGQFLRCVLESLALAYRRALEELAGFVPHPPRVLKVVGGGCRNRVFMRFIADAVNLPVLAGPAEAAAIGNLGLQLIAQNECAGSDELREILSHSFAVETYEPRETARRDDAALRYAAVIARAAATD